MELEHDIVVDQGQPAAEAEAANPILNPPKEEPQPEANKPAEPEKPEDPPIPKGVQKRIDRAVRQKYEAEARAKMLEERLERLERDARGVAGQQQSSDDKEPTIDKFDNFDQYVAAKAEYIARRQIESTLSEREKAQKAEYEAAARQKTAEGWAKRIAQATAEMPDFEDVLGASEIPMTDAMQQAIMESDVGPRLAYWLAQNPDEAYKISQASPVNAIRMLGRIEERLEQPVEKQVTRAPAPLKSVGGKATAKKSPADMTDAEYAKWRKSGKAA